MNRFRYCESSRQVRDVRALLRQKQQKPVKERSFKMGLSDDGDDAEAPYEDLCMDLNLDKTAKEEAWENFVGIKRNYSLEVRIIYFWFHLLVAAMFVLI